MTKYSKTPFSGNSDERAYLLGLRVVDLYARTHGRCVRVSVSTTHPAMIKLMQQIFQEYSRVVVIPKYLKKWKQFEWEVYSYLDSSFEFILQKTIAADESFLNFLAGFFDAEGSITVKRQARSTTTRVITEVFSNDLQYLTLLANRLRKLGYHPLLPSKPMHPEGAVVGYGPYTRNFWRLSVNRTQEAVRLLSSLPIKHREKVLKRELAVEYHDSPWKDIVDKVETLRLRIRGEVRACVEEAKKAYLTKRIKSN